ncbi:MAG TPA: hypothetical protein VFU06_00065 [Longimicrobiales bacterium]|nr:hypothetical protein [Longimicrobiales bacterium]
MKRIVALAVLAASAIIASPYAYGLVFPDEHVGHDPARHDEYARFVPQMRRHVRGMAASAGRMNAMLEGQQEREAMWMAYNAEMVR